MSYSTDALPQLSNKQRHDKKLLHIVARHDLPASLVVFLIAIPLSLGIASVTGAPLMAGIIAAVVGGLVAGVLGGAPLQITGASTGLTIIMAELIQTYGWPATAGITVAAGLVQVVLGITKLGRAALSLSPAVVHGMLAGIGAVIAIGQLHIVLGGTPQHSVIDNIRELPGQIIRLHGHATTLGLLVIAILLIWPRLPHVNKVPAPLVAVVGATMLANSWEWNVARINLPDDPLAVLALPQLPQGQWDAILIAIVTVAIVASVESLLSAVAVDRLHSGPRANLDRELTAQGISNVVSGGLGGLPVASAIVRSSTNVAAGARTRFSAVLHGIWVAGFVLIAAGLLELIPLAVLAAILVVTGIRLIDVEQIRTLIKHHELSVYLITVLGVVLFGIIEGVLAGIAVALFRALYRVIHATIHTENSGPGQWRVIIHGSLMFWNVGRLTRQLNAVPPDQRVTVELHTDFMDHATYEALAEWRASYTERGGHVDLEEIHGDWYQRAADGRPGLRKTLLMPPPRWFAPWSAWQSREQTAEDDPMLQGMREFAQHGAPLLRPYLVDLANEQRPTQLFITCADSRVVPNIITSSGPGDLFCIRNIANVVPHYRSHGDDSVGAAIEYAIDVLEVTSIVVCGHSNCGGVRAALERETVVGHPQILRWLRHVKASVIRLHRLGPPPGVKEFPLHEQLCVTNVMQQLDNVASYPSVQAAQEAGKLRLVGLYFDIQAAQVYLINPQTGALEEPPDRPQRRVIPKIPA